MKERKSTLCNVSVLYNLQASDAYYSDSLCKPEFALNENSSSVGPAMVLLSSTPSASVVTMR